MPGTSKGGRICGLPSSRRAEATGDKSHPVMIRQEGTAKGLTALRKGSPVEGGLK